MSNSTPVYAQLVLALGPTLEKLQLRLEEKGNWVQIVCDANGHRVDLRKDIARIPLCDTTVETLESLPLAPLPKPNGRVMHLVQLGDTKTAYPRLKLLVEQLASAPQIRAKKRHTAGIIPTIVVDEEPTV